MKITGKISKDDAERVIGVVKEKMEKTEECFHFYVELKKWSGISLAALVEDMKSAIPNMR